MPLFPISLPPGVWRNGTQYQSAGRWYDANLVRWSQGVMRPIGGWTLRTTSQFSGTPRNIIVWRSNNRNAYVAVGTNSNLYVITQSNTIVDITPENFIPGEQSSDVGFGYGLFEYGTQSYGVSRYHNIPLSSVSTWSFDTWGEHLVCCAVPDGRIYYWDLNVANDAVRVPNSPSGCVGVVVTEERHLMAIGAGGNPRKVQWSDQEDMTTWTPTQLNKAGSFILPTAGSLKCAKKFVGGLLLFTDVDFYAVRSVGYPFVYGFERMGMNCGVIGPHAATAVESSVYWMGRDSFYFFDGIVNKVKCDVHDYVFSSMNIAQAEKTFSFYNSVNSEIWWLYCSSDSLEVDSYVALNIADGHWTIGKLSRTCGHDQGVFITPIMCSPDGYVYDHEIGSNYDGAVPYAESGPFEIGSGDKVIHAVRFIPDERTGGQASVMFKMRNWPNAAEISTPTYPLSSPTSVRFTGRQVSMRVSGGSNNWRWGSPRLEIRQGGYRG